MNPIASLLAAVPELTTTQFPQTSRYYGAEIRRHTLPDGKDVAYLGRRFVPSPDRFELLREHTIVEGDRLDNLAAAYLGDPEQFWRLADANHGLNPFDLTATVSRRLRITLPEGVPAMPPLT
jgi:hypothetical protein